jgi:putative membrane protein
MKPLPILLAATALIAVPALAQQMSPAQYVKAAGASDLYERESAHLVLQSTKNPKIRSFAEMMITDHGKSTAMVKAAAEKSHVALAAPVLTPEQSKMIEQLRGQSGTARDTTYIAQQKQAHDQALAVQKAYAASGTDAALKATAAQIVPVVQHHIALLNTM